MWSASLLGVIVERVVVVAPGAVVVVIQQPAIGRVPDLEVRCCPENQHHHHNDSRGDGHNAPCTQGAWDLFHGDPGGEGGFVGGLGCGGTGHSHWGGRWLHGQA